LTVRPRLISHARLSSRQRAQTGVLKRRVRHGGRSRPGTAAGSFQAGATAWPEALHHNSIAVDADR
jgi:hypothetical protein